MSKPLDAVKNVGKFFGITRSESEEWRNRTERQIKEGEFGITLKTATSLSKHDGEQDKFVRGAQKVLSRIGAFQAFEESQEHLDETDETSTDTHKSAQVGKSEEPMPGTSKSPEDTESQPLSLTTPKKTRSLGKQQVYNKAYTENDDEETDIDTGLAASKKRKSKVTFDVQVAVNFERSAKSVDHIPQEKVEETEKQKGTKVYSDPYIAYKSLVDDKPSVEKETEQDGKKAKLIFFDELVWKPQMNDLEMPKHSFDSLTKTKAMKGKEKNEEYTKMKEKQENSRSSPEISLDKVKVNELQPNVEAAELKAVKSEKDTDTEGSKTQQSVKKEDEDSVEAVGTAESDNKGDKETAVKLRPEDVVYGKEALKQYKFYLQIEKKVEKQKLQAELENKLNEYDWKLAAIDEMILLAKDYYINPKSKKAARWKDLKRKVKRSSSHQIGHTEYRRKLGTLPDYKPFFTYFIIFAQLVSFIVICGLYGFTFIGVEPKLTLESDIQTFMGMETVHKWTAPNVWIGPSERNLIGLGAVFAPCMRTDIQLQLEQSQQNYSTDAPLGCCEVATRNVAGTTTESECELLTEGVGKWKGDVTCENRPANMAGTRHNMKPCCLGVKGQCQLLSHKHCVFLGGIFYQFGPEHCSQVMCLKNICHPGSLTASVISPWQPESPGQWWRVPLSLLYHHGIIQFVTVTAAQWILLRQIECTAGWFRMLVIYIVSGTMSLLTSAIFLPYQSHCGGMGAVCGMVGVVLVELFHFWKLVHRPLIELAKLSVVIVLLLFCGTLPYLDIFGMMTGLITGALCGLILLPYITFGKRHLRMRVILIVGASTLLFMICFFLLQVFAYVQSVESCEGCKTLNCVPYTDKMCDTSLWQQF
ncbi:uncharacterized protein LOC123546962 isoform X2 [Mercenaria mercenaria]|nr:uncharacterized protein LOC123546962 isoform X2 [Mercenaria mercenaria]